MHAIATLQPTMPPPTSSPWMWANSQRWARYSDAGRALAATVARGNTRLRAEHPSWTACTQGARAHRPHPQGPTLWAFPDGGLVAEQDGQLSPYLPRMMVARHIHDADALARAAEGVAAHLPRWEGAIATRAQDLGKGGFMVPWCQVQPIDSSDLPHHHLQMLALPIVAVVLPLLIQALAGIPHRSGWSYLDDGMNIHVLAGHVRHDHTLSPMRLFVQDYTIITLAAEAKVDLQNWVERLERAFLSYVRNVGEAWMYMAQRWPDQEQADKPVVVTTLKIPHRAGEGMSAHARMEAIRWMRTLGVPDTLPAIRDPKTSP